MGQIYLQQIDQLTDIITRLACDLDAATKTDHELRRLCTVPGIGPVTAGAIAAFAPDLETFDSGRNFAAWLGLVPQHSTGGKTRLTCRVKAVNGHIQKQNVLHLVAEAAKMRADEKILVHGGKIPQRA